MDVIEKRWAGRPTGRALIAAAIGFILFAAAQSINPIAAADELKPVTAAQDTNKPGLVAEIVECKREGGVLSIRMRLRNSSDKEIDESVIEERNFHQFYVTAGAKKYLIMEDSEKVPLSTPAHSGGNLSVKLPKGATWIWWAKYTAPPPEIKSINYYTPLAPPFDGVPITE
jgi:hypothetical protein